MEVKETEAIRQIGLTSAEPEPKYEILTTMRWIPGRAQALEMMANGGSNAISQAIRMHSNDLLSYHLDRLKRAAEACGLTEAFKTLQGKADKTGVELLLEAIDETVGDHGDDEMWKPRLVRITIDKEGHIRATSSILVDIKPFVLAPLQHSIPTNHFFYHDSTSTPSSTVFIDPDSTMPSLFTTHKTTHRPMYNRARIATEISGEKPQEVEVLLHNERGEVMEASMSTPYFSRNGSWWTPAASSGGNLGVTRKFAMNYGQVGEAVIMVSSLQDGEVIWLSNAVRGYWRARLLLGSRGDESTSSTRDDGLDQGATEEESDGQL